jgi:hypothetical protein
VLTPGISVTVVRARSSSQRGFPEVRSEDPGDQFLRLYRAVLPALLSTNESIRVEPLPLPRGASYAAI